MVRHIPESLAVPFSVWMMDKGFISSRSKNNEFVLKLDKETLKIAANKLTVKGFEMNHACQKRFLSFCRVYLSKDQNFVKALRMRGDLRIAHTNVNDKAISICISKNLLVTQFNN